MVRTLAVTTVAVVLGASLAHAEAPQDRFRTRARTYLVVRISEELQLSDADALKVGTVLRQSEERRQALMREREGLATSLRTALAKSPADAAEISGLVARLNGLDQQIALVPEDSFRELQKSLTVEQQARLVLLRRELQGEIRRAMQRRLGGRRGGAGPDAPGGPGNGGGHSMLED